MTTSGYVIAVEKVCLVVLMTLRLFEVVSETREEQKPMAALRPNLLMVSSGVGIFSCKKLNVKNQGKWPKIKIS